MANKMKKQYVPEPLDTSGVTVPPDLAELGECLAKNAHDTWARQRIGEGWSYGELRDAELKTHPDLVPYEELPESEKEYDRKTSMETIKVILSMGYRITKVD